MANNDFDDDFNFDDDEQDNTQQQGDGPKELRALVRKQAKELKELREANEQFVKTQRSASIGDLLKNAGVNPKVATFIPADVEASEDAVNKWLGEYGELFGAGKQDTATSDGGAATEPTASQDDAQASEWGRMRQAEQGGTPAVAEVGGDKLVAELESLKGQGSAVIAKWMKDHGLSSRG